MTKFKSSLRERLPRQAVLFYRKSRSDLEHILPDAIFYQEQHFKLHGCFCNFKNPERFTEKIFYRMRRPLPIFSLLADKIRVREYIERIIGAQYLVPCHLICERVTPEIIETLPASFVMKANHSSGQLRIVPDKTRENLESLSQIANTWLKSDFSKSGREKHYASIPPKIIFEKALLTNGKPPADYKINVFNSKPGARPYIFIEVFRGRFEKMTENFFLEDWSVAPFTICSGPASNDPELLVPPKKLETMLDIAKRLSAPFGYLRVDLYEYEEKIYVGELTVTPGAGDYRFNPPEWNLTLGKKFGWPEDPSITQAEQPRTTTAGQVQHQTHAAFWSDN